MSLIRELQQTIKDIKFLEEGYVKDAETPLLKILRKVQNDGYKKVLGVDLNTLKDDEEFPPMNHMQQEKYSDHIWDKGEDAFKKLSISKLKQLKKDAETWNYKAFLELLDDLISKKSFS